LVFTVSGDRMVNGVGAEVGADVELVLLAGVAMP
jgi:hypothetical protein